AVDPRNAMHVVVAYGNSPDSKQLQLVVTESTDGGMNWTQKFATPTSTGGIRSALPALSILQNGAIGLLYASYDHATNKLSQHLLTTTNDFGSTNDVILPTESNAIPVAQSDPYLGAACDTPGCGQTFSALLRTSSA